MLHHVALEVSPGGIAEESRFCLTIGFQEVPVPESLGDGFSWFELGGTQIHLLHTDAPVVPPGGHVAVAVDDYQRTFDRLAEAGYEISEGTRHWGERRAKVISPAGHSVEIMAAPPLPVVD